MKTVGIKTLKNKLSEYVKLAAAGETIQVTDRGLVVAELMAPIEAHVADPQKAFWDDAVRRGIIHPAKDPHAPIPRPKGTMTLKQVLKKLDEDRSDR